MDEGINTWKIIGTINILFTARSEKHGNCDTCSKPCESEYASRFWCDGTRCPAGHSQEAAGQEEGERGSLRMCMDCERRFILGVIQGRQQCRIQGCNRLLRVNTDAAAVVIGPSKILQSFLALVDTVKVFECIVCFDEIRIGLGETNSDPPTPGCNHERNICDECLKMAYETKIKAGKVDITCPAPDCAEAVSLQHLRSKISKDCFKAHTRRLSSNTLSRNPKFRWCACGHGQVHIPGERDPEWKCVSCKRIHCFLCRDITKDTCEHLQGIRLARKEDQRQAAQYVLAMHVRGKRENVSGTRNEIVRTTKLCPNAGCRTRIERNGGCAHFTCKNCSVEFCWCCKVIFRSGRALHLDTCSLRPKTAVTMQDLDTTGYTIGWDADEGYDVSLDRDLWIPSNLL